MKLANLGPSCSYCKGNMCCNAMHAHVEAVEAELQAIKDGQCPDCGGAGVAGEHAEIANDRCITCKGTGSWDVALAEAREALVQVQERRQESKLCHTQRL